MYDKYNNVTPLQENVDLPKHKGILYSKSAAGSLQIQFYGTTGGTYNTTLSTVAGINIIPINVKKVIALDSGTAWLLN